MKLSIPFNAHMMTHIVARLFMWGIRVKVSEIMNEHSLLMKHNLDNLMKQYKVQPVGKGYIDCIVTWENVFCFVDNLSKIDIKIRGLTWWCHCKDQSSGCPHGMGGPLSEYYGGWFSEMQFPLVEFESNEQVIAYLKAPNDPNILGCFVPALWLDVPDGWVNELERTRK